MFQSEVFHAALPGRRATARPGVRLTALTGLWFTVGMLSLNHQLQAC